jgi:hypothetical protein
MLKPEELAVLKTHSTWILRDMLRTKESFILYAIEQKWFEDVPRCEEVVSLIKAELARRGEFSEDDILN